MYKIYDKLHSLLNHIIKTKLHVAVLIILYLKSILCRLNFTVQ
ncbi:MAG: hypothetical protein BWX96_00804 [Bacteroidetes bacterium ADurb.Bin145]|nr:MAG: hypothetical protein BWX96_00804 [Bacteroidetes bacterium ADurb.Bin145]